MAEQIPLIDVKPNPVEPPKPSIEEMYLVFAWNGRWWKCHRESNQQEFHSIEAADKYARLLSAQWTHRCIVRIPLGVY